MPLQLPVPVARYFDADNTCDADAVVTCFTDDAVVTDEGAEHRGRAAIRAWKAGASRAFTYTVEPFAVESQGECTVVTGHLTGNFPGSPVDLRYFFTLAADRIAALEIRP